MPFGFNKASSDVESIVGIQFGIFSPEEIRRRSVVEIVTQTPYEGNEPKIGGLFDPRMGVLENGKTCRSCGQTNHGCPGHFGHYELTRPVYYIQFLPMIQNVLRCICVKCSKLLIEKDMHKDVLKRKGEVRWREVLTRCKSVQRCGQETEDGCGAPQPNNYKKEGIARIEANFGDAGTQPLDVEYVLRLFRRITDEDVDFLGLSRFWCRPDWMICQVLPIPPPQVRPSVVQDNNQRSEDDLTHKLFEIIKYDKMLAQKIENNAAKPVIEEWTNILQYHIATLVDNQIPGVAPSAQRSGRPLKSLTQRLGAKEGRIRYNIQGKRVEYSARSVITPDPNLSIAELGVPEKIAMNLTVPDRVTPYNREKLYKYVQNGADKYPGAKTIVRSDGRMISLRHINTRELVLHHGDIVNRHLMDGDILLFNRQPTLHRMSMMGHRVRVLPYNTFRLNVSVTTPYNADFDGDEMNAHCPQSLEAAVELEDIAAVPHQIITPRHGKPAISIVQDTLLGSYRICRDGVTFNRREFMDLMIHNKRFTGIMPPPRAGTEEAPRWTGQQILSMLLPPINMEMKNKLYDDQPIPQNFVKIKNGIMEQGIIDKDIYSKPSKGIIHMTYNDYGPQQTVELIDSLQNTISKFLVLNGFSVGISDLIADEGTRAEMDTKIQEKKRQIAEIILQVHLDLFDNNTGRTNQDEFESRVLEALNEATKESGNIGIKSLADDNRLMSMVRSGSKGGPVNVSQMMACVGQQNIENKRIPYGFQDRTLPHYKKYDDSAEARGFIESSFIRGLTPQEFFFHAMSGREGLIDTAVKTADTGYIQRQMVKGMEDLLVQHDGTVRDAGMNIVQFAYGEDGINATKIEAMGYPLGKMTRADIDKEFGLEGVDLTPLLQDGVERGADKEALATYKAQVLEDRRVLVELVFNKGLQGGVYGPVNLERVIDTVRVRFALQKELEVEGGPKQPVRTDLTPAHVIAGIEKLINKTQTFSPLWAGLLRFYLSPLKMIEKHRFTKAAFDTMCEVIVTKNWQSWVVPGEQVGILAAQSIGEPSTQMVLNTFHLAGVASKSNVTGGLPRLKELLKVTQNPKATSLTIYLKKEHRQSKEKAREVSQQLELTMLRDITLSCGIYYDPKDEQSVKEEDRDLLAFYRLYEQGAMAEQGTMVSDSYTPFSPWILRLELNREKMFDRNISMYDIAFVLRDKFPNCSLVYSDYNAQKLVMRIRVQPTAGMDSIADLKRYQNKLLSGVILRGAIGLKSVAFRKDETVMEEQEGAYAPVTQYILDTDGSNFLEVMNHPAVDGNKLYSTNVHDLYDQYGIEVARAGLLKELTIVFEEAGVNIRHLGLLVDVMTRSGRLMSMDRYGINKRDIGPLAKASFEETGKILLKASLFGEVDPVTGVSANIMTGQPIRGGTAFSQIIMDETAVVNLYKGLPPAPELDMEEETDFAALAELEDPYGTTSDACSAAKFQMSVQLPPVSAVQDEDDITLNIMQA
jgi:DNA-directed RNA polymerase II subunit RPB1